MNKRIEELSKLAFDAVWNLDKTTIGPSTHFAPDGFERKFAELIVRECISQIENLSPGYEDYRNQIEDAFRRDCVDQLKQHFGVKE